MSGERILALGPAVAAAWNAEAALANLRWSWQPAPPDAGALVRDDGLTLVLRPQPHGRIHAFVRWPVDPEHGPLRVEQFAGRDALDPSASVAGQRADDHLARELARRVRVPATRLWPACLEMVEQRAGWRAERQRVAAACAAAAGVPAEARFGSDLYLRGHARAGGGYFDIRVMPGGGVEVKASIPGAAAPAVAAALAAALGIAPQAEAA